MTDPEQQVGVSIGTASVLGLARVRMETAPTTAYLMIGGRCTRACGFCAQARDSHSSALNLSRVTWPLFPLATLLPALREAAPSGAVRRVCLQVTAGRGSYDEALALLQALRATVTLPINVAILPRGLEQVEALLEAGADHVGLGLDAVTPAVYARVKGRRWEEAAGFLERAARRFPGRISVHAIVGLGESEQEAVQALGWLHGLGVVVGLFAFTPVAGTRMAGTPPPPLDAYRRLQVARHLIAHGLSRAETFRFDPQGRICHFGVDDPAALIPQGQCFRTSGCPDCNRPYYNERPGGVMYNYPRPLTPEE
ncbi:MAG: radical SAM protein, partial [Chloroflexi bacterium]|nr:radical SAM protein [Chloroflexota bacterium]